MSLKSKITLLLSLLSLSAIFLSIASTGLAFPGCAGEL